MIPVDGRTQLPRLLHAVLLRLRAEARPLADGTVPPLTGAHVRLLDRLPPEGARVTDLAQQMRITKQALGQLAGQLADRGYVEVLPDPADRRAKLVRAAPRGAAATEAVRLVLAEVEDAWRAQVGADRYAVFRAVLEELAEPHDPRSTRTGP